MHHGCACSATLAPSSDNAAADPSIYHAVQVGAAARGYGGQPIWSWRRPRRRSRPRAVIGCSSSSQVRRESSDRSICRPCLRRRSLRPDRRRSCRRSQRRRARVSAVVGPSKYHSTQATGFGHLVAECFQQSLCFPCCRSWPSAVVVLPAVSPWALLRLARRSRLRLDHRPVHAVVGGLGSVDHHAAVKALLATGRSSRG